MKVYGQLPSQRLGIEPGIKEVDLVYECGDLRLCYSFDGSDKLSILQFDKQIEK